MDQKIVVAVEGRDSLSGQLKSIESGVIRFVGAVSSTLAALTAVSFPIVQAAQYQKELLNAAKTTEYTEQEIARLRDGLSALSTQTNVTAVDLAKIATMGGQIGIGSNGRVEALLSFVTATATAVTALDLPAEAVVASFGKLINLFDIPPDQFRNAISALNQVSNVSNATADQLFDVVRRIGNLGGSVTLPEAAALSATLIDLGLTAETAGTTITKIFADFKADAGSFASLVQSEAIPTTKDWVDLVARDGIGALNAYLDTLNKLGTAEAAAAKGRLTGEGRLFEAVTKLQQQRIRELDFVKLRDEAERKLVIAQKESNGENNRTVAGLQKQRDAYAEAAIEANVLARLTKNAQEAYKAGDSAEKEQARVLSGAIAQSQVFVNNLTSVAVALGSEFLPSITRGLMQASKALQDPVTMDGLRTGAREFLDLLGQINDVIQSLRTSLQGVFGSSGQGVDWGALFKVSALVAAYAALKLIARVSLGVSEAMLAALPGARRFGDALLGVSPAMQKARADAEKLTAEHTRTNTGMDRLRAGAVSFAEYADRSSANTVKFTNQVTRLRTSAMLTSDALDKLFAQRRLGGFQNAKDIDSAIATQYARLNSAVAAGASNRQLGGIKSNITYLERQHATALRLEERTNRLSQAVMAASQRLYLHERSTYLVSRAQSLATSTTAVLAFVTRGYSVAIGEQVGKLNALIVRMAGLSAAYQAAATSIARASIVAASALTLLGRGISLVAKAMLSIVNFAFFAVLIAEVLKLAGAWDTVASKVQKAASFLGFDDVSWLRTTAQMKEQAKAMSVLQQEYKKSREVGESYTSLMQGLITQYSELSEAQKNLKFDVAEPTKAASNAKEVLDATITGYSRLVALTATLANLDKQRTAAGIALEAQKRKASKQQDGAADSNEALQQARRDFDAINARIDDIKKAMSGLEDLPQATRNLLVNTLDAAEATALLGKTTEGGLSPLRRYLELQVLLNKSQLDEAKTLEELNTYFTNSSDSVAQMSEKQQKLRDGMEESRAAQKRYTAEMKTLADSMTKASTAGSTVEKIIQSINKNADAKGLEKMVSVMEQVYKTSANAFKNLTVPQVTADSLLSAAVTATVSRRVADMYREWSIAAQNSAQTAKNYLTQVRNEVENNYRNMRILFELIDANAKKAQDKLARRDGDRADDEALRKSLADIETRKEADVAAIRERYETERRYFGLSGEVAGDAAALKRQLDEREKAELRGIEEQYRKLQQAEEDRVEAKKQAREGADEIAMFDSQLAKIKELSKEVDKQNAILAKDKATAQELLTATAKRKELLDQSNAAYSEMESIARRISDVNPAQDVSKIKKALEEANAAISQGQLKSAGDILRSQEQIAKGVGAQATKYDQLSTEAIRRFLALTSEVDKSAAQIGKIMASSPDFRNMIEDIRKRTEQGLIDPKSINFEQIDKDFAKLQETLKNTKPITVLSPEQQEEAKKFESDFTEMIRKVRIAVKGDKDGVSVGVKLDTDSLKNVVDQIQAEKPVITATVKADVLDIGGQSIALKGIGAATGGLIAMASGYGALVRKFSFGGSVNGPGTSTSDSIPAWLSAGEFVTRAKAVAYYGADLFHRLNAMQIPRSGVKMAAGGYVNGNDAGGTPQRIDLSINSRRIGVISGSRETVQALVSALQDLNGAAI